MAEIIVMAGTPVDTAFGMDLVAQAGHVGIPIAVSSTPQAQTRFQVRPKEEKEQVVRDLLQKSTQERKRPVLIYCNSLSAAVDFAHLREATGLSIQTPFDFYRECAGAYQSVGILAANAQGAAGVENVLVNENPAIHAISIGHLGWVEAIESGRPAEDIVGAPGFRAALQLMEHEGVEALVLGCTHFPYFSGALEKTTELRLLNPVDFFRSWLQSYKED